jgi:serine/threonine-protein kinase SRPK3
LSAAEVEKMKEMDLRVRLCDMGNACYTHKHYSDIIQTREYRSPEVILGGNYDESADLWSLACMIFELITGDYLFDPKKGKTFRKNDDHLALITELIGPCYDLQWLQVQPKVWKFYNKKTMKLKNIGKLKPWPLEKVLIEKYRLNPEESKSLADFLLKMLKWKPKDRASAREMLQHPWLKEPERYNVWMSKGHLREYKIVNHRDFPGFLEELKKEEEEAEEDRSQ